MAYNLNPRIQHQNTRGFTRRQHGQYSQRWSKKVEAKSQSKHGVIQINRYNKNLDQIENNINSNKNNGDLQFSNPNIQINNNNNSINILNDVTVVNGINNSEDNISNKNQQQNINKRSSLSFNSIILIQI